MPERHPVPARRPRLFNTALALLTVIAVAVGVAACTDDIEGGAACPALCPSQPNEFRDTTIDVVELDTTIGGFPTLNVAPTLSQLLANRKDTVEISSVVKFDVLPLTFTPDGSGTAIPITGVDSVFLFVVIDSTGARGLTQVELQAYDVDTTEVLPSPEAVRALFRPDRLIGSLPITTVAARDTVRIPISKAVLMQKISGALRFRIGLRLAGTTSSQVRFLAFNGGFPSPVLAFDPAPDTSYIPVGVAPNTAVGGSTNEELLAGTVTSLSTKETPDAGPQTLSVGGFPSRRSYLRFNIPKSILDSSTVVRAELLLTQKRSAGVDGSDTISVVPLLGVSTNIVTDLRRAMDLAAAGIFVGLDSMFVVPNDTGVRSLNVLGVVRNWAQLPENILRVIVLRTSNEGAEPAEARFFSAEAPAGLRPRLKITYLPRVDRALP